MRRHVVATVVVVTCGVGMPLLAQSSTPIPAQPSPTPPREPVNTAPPQPEPPVRLEVPASPGSAPDPKAGKDETGDEPDQGRGSGRGGRGGASGRGTASPASRSAMPPGRGPAAHPSGGPRGWWGPAWGSPAYYFAHPYYWDPFWVSGAFAWSPLFYAPWPLMWGTAGYWPWPYSYGPPTTFMTGGVRLKVKPREAQVIVDGYYAGTVNDFDGVFQALRLAPGGHKIEVRMDGFQTASFDIHVQPDRMLTVTQNLSPNP